jgi:sterol desaturase/sphingolipid hydroxylase (fatty acid hydroxylase superfamily)
MMAVAIVLVVAGVIAVLLRLEAASPIEPNQPRAELKRNYTLVAINVLLNQLLKPVASFSGAMIVNAMGGGFIELRADGWWFGLSLIVLVLTIEIVSYLIHRLQHALPVLWAMHSLHHSAESLNLVVGARHYWFEGVAMVAFLPFIDVFFRTRWELMFATAIIYFLPDQCAHLNIRFSLGRFGLCINHPQYHRIHHSVLPQHKDKNFCKLLPAIDVLFGTAWKPSADEFPPTGLATGIKTSTLMDGLLWPFRLPSPGNTAVIPDPTDPARRPV